MLDDSLFFREIGKMKNLLTMKLSLFLLYSLPNKLFKGNAIIYNTPGESCHLPGKIV